ncbi:MAG: hypothetical protein A2X48_13085 [Lentisphaerae bacterium GWF2_49_21]|nr:MAG: hypothetical protein A2X48_13085 [Lentisphaerae bacterium GWF2_49_21]
MKKKIKWGIIGTGKIANRFADALSNLEDAGMAAVASRSMDTGKAFAAKYGIATVHVGYENLVADPEIDVVFIGTPHIFHLRDALMCFQAGKHVLCEKPLTLNAEQAEKMIAAAREKKVFLMEAMWTRFFPIHVKIRELLVKQALGKLRMLQVNFCYCAPDDLENRFFNHELGGGVLMDAGSYGISFATSLFGPPAETTAIADFGPTGVDFQSSCLLRHKNGEISTIATSMISPDVKNATIVGEKGRIDIDSAWYKPTGMTVSIDCSEPQRFDFPLPEGYNGYEYEAEEVMNCIRAGKTESAIMPLDETLSIMRTLDKARSQIGLEYPGEASEKYRASA